MVSVDTNVVVRLLVSDDLNQQQEALRRITAVRDAGEEALVTSVVLAEISWVLDSCYGYGRADIASALRKLMQTRPFFLPDRGALISALDWYEVGKADFADYFVLALSLAQGANTLLTFDKKLLSEAHCSLP